MQTREAVIIGAFVAVGLAAHAYITRPADLPSAAERQQASQREVQKKMLEVQPRSIPLGEQTILCMPRVGFRGDSLDVNYDLFRYEAGKLVRVPIQ